MALIAVRCLALYMLANGLSYIGPLLIWFDGHSTTTNISLAKRMATLSPVFIYLFLACIFWKAGPCISVRIINESSKEIKADLVEVPSSFWQLGFVLVGLVSIINDFPILVSHLIVSKPFSDELSYQEFLDPVERQAIASSIKILIGILLIVGGKKLALLIRRLRSIGREG